VHIHKHPLISDNGENRANATLLEESPSREGTSALILSFWNFVGEDIQRYTEISSRGCPWGPELGVAAPIQLANALFAAFQLEILFGRY